MIVTEEEAKTKRCQESFGDQHVTNGGHMVGLSGAGGAVAVVTSPANCIGSACMAWRRRWRIIDREGNPRNDMVFDREPKNLVDGLAAQALGFCGKAGKP